MAESIWEKIKSELNLEYGVSLALHNLRSTFYNIYRTFEKGKKNKFTSDQLVLLNTIKELKGDKPTKSKRTRKESDEDAPEPPKKKAKYTVVDPEEQKMHDCFPHQFKSVILGEELLLFCEKCGIIRV